MQATLIPVPFYEDTLVLTGKDNEPLVVMKPIVENMGLYWSGQQAKLTEKFGSTIQIICTVAEDGKKREMVCLPLRKLPAWLYSINPNKVAPELREKITRYQEECDDALWNYWTQGTASRPGSLSVTERLRVHRARHSLLEKLEVTTHAIRRAALHEELHELSQLLGYPTPELKQIGSTEPDEPTIITELWEAVAELQSQGHKINHTRTAGVIAINLREFTDLANQHQLELAARNLLRQQLPLSRQHRFQRYATVNSAITGKSIKCYVFAQGQEEFSAE